MVTVRGKRFRRRAWRRGYRVDDVDSLLDRVEATLAGEAGEAPVTANDIREVAFRVRLGGYDEWQVDLHLDRVERKLADLGRRQVSELGQWDGSPAARPDHMPPRGNLVRGYVVKDRQPQDSVDPLPDGKQLAPDDPERIDRYKILRRLGEGAMGTVYLAQGGDNTMVALKVLRRELACDTTFLRRFAYEVEHARRVNATYTARVFEAVTDPDRQYQYLATEYVEGPTLAQHVRQTGPLAAHEAKALAIGTAAGLIAIHRAGIVHRDLKPSNVMLSYHGPRIIDFGIAHSSDITTSLTHDGGIVGTPSYMSPEQLQQKPVGPESDIFSWAGVMVFAVAGRPAFGEGGAANLYSIMLRTINGEPDLADVPGELRGLLVDALHKKPTERPTARQLLARLTDTSLLEVDSSFVGRHRVADEPDRRG